jgi:hypothetical protein
MRHRRGFVWLAVPIALCATFVACGPAEIPQAESPELPNPWFRQQRAGDGGFIPVNARSRALAVARASGALQEDSTATWTPAGPRNIGGRISSLAIDPNDDNHLWMGAADGGVFESFDSGDTWTPVFDDQTALSIGSIAVHPTHSSIVYVGTGEEAGGGWSYDGEGVLKTTDGGATWTNMGLGEVRRIGRVAIDPVDPQRVFVAASGGLWQEDADRGVYRSTDGGSSWTKVLFVANDTGVVDVAIDPSNPNRIYAATWQRTRANNHNHFGGVNSGIHRSLDGGDTWTQLAGGLPTGSLGRIGLAIAPSSTDVVYAIIGTEAGGLNGIYRSLDAGDTWSRVNQSTLPFFFSSFTYYFGQIRVDPQNANIVYALDLNLWRSTTGGSNFGNISGSLHADQHALEIDGSGRIFVGNDGGFYKSLDNAASWIHNQTLAISQFYDLCIDELDPNRRYGGTQDNGTLRTTTAGLDDWANVIGGDGMQCEVDPSDSNKVYGESQWGNLRRSTDGGDTFVDATSGIDPADRVNWVAPVVIDRVTPTRLYTGTYRVYRSVDSAVSWTAITPDLTNGPGDGPDVSGDPDWRETTDHGASPIQGTVTAIGVSPVDNTIVWAGTDDGNVWVSSDDGVQWTQVNPPGPAYWVTDIVPDPYDAQKAWLTVSGFRSDDRMPYVRVTEDLGQTWQTRTGGLPEVPVSSIAPDPFWQAQLFIGTDVGVFRSEDAGNSWTFLPDGIPYVVVQDLVLHDPSRTLFAGTHARSIFSLDLTLLPDPDGDGDGADNNSDCALDDGGAFAVPGEVPSLAVGKGPAGEAELSWSSLSGSAGSGTVYDLATEALANLRANGGTGSSGSLACGVPGTTFSDGGALSPGDGVYYLVRGANVCGIGPWGFDSIGGARGSSACP